MNIKYIFMSIKLKTIEKSNITWFNVISFISFFMKSLDALLKDR